MYFTISDLQGIDSMYQYSLLYFIKIFNQSIDKAEASGDINVRIASLKSSVILNIYNIIKR